MGWTFSSLRSSQRERSGLATGGGELDKEVATFTQHYFDHDSIPFVFCDATYGRTVRCSPPPLRPTLRPRGRDRTGVRRRDLQALPGAFPLGNALTGVSQGETQMVVAAIPTIVVQSPSVNDDLRHAFAVES